LRVPRLPSTFLICALAASPVAGERSAVSRIAFGSCNHHDSEQPVWDAVLACSAQVWIWTGDIVEADTEDMEATRTRYEWQKLRPGYRAVRERCRVLGTWDDDDYGLNNGGREYAKRAQSQQLLLDFLDEPAESRRRHQQGVYASAVLGPPGRRVKVILLDTRYHREAPGPEGDVLGEVQWRWLEYELAASDAQVHVVVSSIQVLPTEHPFEKWANFPRSRERLLATLARSRAQGVVLVSGDRHIGEISCLPRSVVGYPLFEVTSSGLTHSWAAFPGEPNSLRRGEVYAGLNFGLIEIDWAAEPVQLRLEVRDASGAVRVPQAVPLPDLAARH
jgi:alkaline phosphatase D